MLAVYREGGDGFGGLEFVRSSHPPEGVESDGIEVIFYAEEGVHYTIRLGSRGQGGSSEFTMRWSETEAPTWLRYASRLADGDLDSEGTSVQLEGPFSMAFNDHGTSLFVASRLGLQVFERDAESGDLTLVQFLEHDALQDSSLIWDPRRSELYAYRYGVWRRFAPVDETDHELQERGTFSITNTPDQEGGLASDIFLDPGGSFLHVVDVGHGRLDVLTFDTSGGLRHVQSQSQFELKRALISNDGSHVYAINNGRLFIFERDSNTGRLTQVQTDHSNFVWRVDALAISSDDRYLFVFDDNGRRTNVFAVGDDPSNPRSLGTLAPFWDEPFWNDPWNSQCGLASERSGIPAVDVFCRNMIFSVQWEPETETLAPTDYAAPWQPDRYNKPCSRFRACPTPRNQPRRSARLPGHGR